MSWKPSVLAALLVVVAGVATGVAVGGNTKTKIEHRSAVTRTVTVERTISVASPTTSATTSTAVGGNTATTQGVDGPPPSPNATFLDASQIREDTPNIGNIESGQTVTLQKGGDTEEATVFPLDTCGNDSDWRFEIPVPDGSQSLQAKVGFEQGAASAVSVKIEFFADRISTRPAVSLRLESTDIIKHLVVPVAGDGLMIVKITPRGGDWSSACDTSPVLAFGEGRFE